MSGAEVLLSICIPTYNRSRFLDYALKDLFSQAADIDIGPFEVLVGDNASTDDTPTTLRLWALNRPELRFIRQTENVGPYGNMTALFRLAKGKYCLYLADDDKLNFAGVKTYIEFMDGNPDVSAAYTPWEFWIETQNCSAGHSYTIPETLVFDRMQGAELMNTIIYHNVLPELCMFRSRAVQAMIGRPSTSYWSYVWLANLLDHGRVAFLPTSYYRSILAHHPLGAHVHVASSEVVANRDSYQGGLEYLAQRMFRNMGCEAVPAEQTASLAAMIGLLLDDRLLPALQILYSINNFIGAHEFLARRLARGLDNAAIYATYGDGFRERLARQASMQRVIETFRSITLLKSILFYRTPQTAELLGYLATVDSSAPARVVEAADGLAAVEAGRVLVVTDSEADRAALVELGFASGLVMRLDDLVRQFVL